MSRPAKTILFWILTPLILSLILLIAINVFATRVVNQKSVKDRIETTASQRLGGRFSYARATISFLPRPRVSIQNPNISIPEQFYGDMKGLDIYPELLPLFGGRLKLAKVLLDRPDIRFTVPGKTGKQAGPEEPQEISSGQTLANIMGLAASKLSIGEIVIEKGRVKLDQDNQPLFTLQEIESRITFALPGSDTEASSKTSPKVSPDQYFRMIGNVQGIVTETERLPKEARIIIGRVEVLPQKISISDARIQLLDSSFLASGSFDDYLTMPKSDLILNGTVGPEMMQWIRAMASLPPELTIHTPVNISQARLSWSRSGMTRLEGSAAVQDDLNLTYDVSWGAEHFVVKNFGVRDRTSQATLSLDLEKKKVLNLAFSGNLTQTMLNRLFEHERFQFGWIRGDIRTRIVLDRPMESTVLGTLEGEQLILPIKMKAPVILNRVSLKASGRTVMLNPVVLTLGDKPRTVTGKITASADRWLMDLNSDGIEWESIQPLFARDENRTESKPTTDEKKSTMQADIRLSTRYFSIGKWKAAPARAEISLGADGIRILLNDAVVCGIDFSGTVEIKSAEISLDLKPVAKQQDLKSTFICLSGGENRITGRFDLSGEFQARGTAPTLLDALQGTVAFKSKSGRLYGDSLVVRILTYLNLAGFLQGKYSDPGKNGVPYDSIVFQGTVQKSVFSLDEAVIISPLAHLAGRGSIKLDGTMDVMVLAAPFTKTDAIVKKIPLVGHVLGDSLITIPVRLSGPIKEPKVEAIPTSAVADGLIGIMDRTLGIPYKIIEPIIPDRKSR